MACQVFFENLLLTEIPSFHNTLALKNAISSTYGLQPQDLFITVNGKSVQSDIELKSSGNIVRVFTKLVGGKGGFGSMLRAIGAQIEKTTNREACRDLSGRRLRDINEEKRLRKWLEGQEEREKEAIERKQKKIEKILAEPKIDVNLGALYEKDRQELPDRLSAAVDAGWQAAGSSISTGVKRKLDNEGIKQKKKQKFWIDADISDCSSLSEDEEENEVDINTGPVVSTDSGNESDLQSEASICNV